MVVKLLCLGKNVQAEKKTKKRTSMRKLDNDNNAVAEDQNKQSLTET